MCFFIFRSSLFGGPCQLLPCRFVWPREEGESDDICFSFHLFFSAPYSTKFSVSSLHTIIGSYFHLSEKEKNFEQKISNTIFHFHIIPAIVFVTCTMKYVTAISLSSFVIFLHDPLNYLLFLCASRRATFIHNQIPTIIIIASQLRVCVLFISTCFRLL